MTLSFCKIIRDKYLHMDVFYTFIHKKKSIHCTSILRKK